MINYLNSHWQFIFYHGHQTLFDNLITHYQQPHRHYHNLTHLSECFMWFDEIKDNLYRPDLVAIALFYHDVIYNPKSPTNEYDSSVMMKDELQGMLSDTDIGITERYILATKDHINPLTGDDKADLDYLLDIDLAILGSDFDRFDEYNHQIRQEYAWVNGLIYHVKRKSVLKGFYNKERIYLTNYFYQALENKARGNLKRYL